MAKNKKPTPAKASPAPKKASAPEKTPVSEKRTSGKPSPAKAPAPKHAKAERAAEKAHDKAHHKPHDKAAEKAHPRTHAGKPHEKAGERPSEKPAEKPAAAEPVQDKPRARDKEPAVKDKGKARDALRSRILGSKKPAKPIAFTLDEVREIAKTLATQSPETGAKAPRDAAGAKAAKVDSPRVDSRPATPNHVKAASLADILGFNPRKAQKPASEDDSAIPEKFRRYYKLLIELRNHVTGQLDQHTEETLKRSSKDDAGDLSSYGQHMADAGTDTFDRDFALSLVSSEQEALSEIEAAIQRIRHGSYGVCEATQKPIAKERLLAVPFTRYSAEAQKEIERNRYRGRTGAGLFAELGEETGPLGSAGGDDGGDD
jgi:RNA polymerase-binding transcription factor DksA